MTSPAPLVSCVIPAHDAAGFLAEAIESALGQSHPAMEVVVVDDGSTDATPEIIARFAGRIRTARQPRSGPAAARERGRRLARGDYLTFLDADDVWDPRKVELQLAHLARHPEEMAVGCLWRDFEDVGEGRRVHGPIQSGPHFTGLLIRRALFDRVGGIDPELKHTDAHDWLFRARRHGIEEIRTVEEVLYLRRIHASNLSHTKDRVRREELLGLVRAHLRSKAP